jgi:hypothetical protein
VVVPGTPVVEVVGAAVVLVTAGGWDVEVPAVVVDWSLPLGPEHPASPTRMIIVGQANRLFGCLIVSSSLVFGPRARSFRDHRELQGSE